MTTARVAQHKWPGLDVPGDQVSGPDRLPPFQNQACAQVDPHLEEHGPGRGAWPPRGATSQEQRAGLSPGACVMRGRRPQCFPRMLVPSFLFP